MKQRLIQNHKIPAKFLKAFSEFADIILWFKDDTENLHFWINGQTNFISIKKLYQEK
jgi:hypothetical protein